MDNNTLKIGMVDADLLDNGTKHPNLAQMKISAYCKSRGHSVKLILDCNSLDYDLIVISQVFNFTTLPEELQTLINQSEKIEQLNTSIVNDIELLESGAITGPICSLGGTGFFPDGGRNLDYVIEHIMPDYHLYDDYIQKKINEGWSKEYFSDYLDYSIGFITRGCFRKCSFCVNKKYDRAFKHSQLSEFLDLDRPKIYLWDDNILAFSGWERIFNELNATGKPFQFRQGIDLRLLTRKRAKVLAESKYHGDYIFAFDHIEDKDIISKRLHSWKKYCNKTTKLYVLCAYDPVVWQQEWKTKHLLESMSETQVVQYELKDVVNTFERIKILMKYGCHPYIMRYESYKESHFKELYIQLARWCNQPEFYKKKSFRQYCLANQEIVKTKDKESAPYKAMVSFEKQFPNIAAEYFDIKYEDLNEYQTVTGYGRSPYPCPICIEEKTTWESIINNQTPIRTIICNYYSRHLDISCLSKCKKKCNVDADIASRKLIKVINEASIKLILDVIDTSDPIPLDSNLIPQPGDSDTGINFLLHTLNNNDKMTFLELGKKLREEGKSNAAYTKYGESYGKYASLLDLAFLTDDRPTCIQINPIGKSLINMSDSALNNFYIKETLRIPIVQNMIRDAKKGPVSITEYLKTIVNGPTINRRLTAIKFFLNVIRNCDDSLDDRLRNIED